MDNFLRLALGIMGGNDPEKVMDEIKKDNEKNGETQGDDEE